jgi:hypothetical protein
MKKCKSSESQGPGGGRRRLGGARVLALVGVVGLVLSAAAPAGAVPDPTAGTGAGTGWEYPPLTSDICGAGLPTSGVPFDNDQFQLSHYGTYVSAPAAGGLAPVAEYLGPTTVSITIDANVAALQGVAPGTCDDVNPIAIVPGPVAITDVEVHGATGFLGGPGGSVDCSGVSTATPAVFTRVNNVVAFTFTTTCSIASNVPGILGTVTGVPITHVISGTMNPCILVPPIGFPTNPECDALVPPPTAGSHLITSYQAVAVQPTS